MNKPFVRQVLPILLAIGLLWYVLKDVPLAELAFQFKQANYRWLSVVLLFTGFYYLTRAARWNLTLQALGYQPSLFRSTIAILAGSLASMLIPGAGELTRCGTLQRTDGVPLAKGIGSVVAERVIDLLMLVVLICLTALLESARMVNYLTGLLTPITSRLPHTKSSGILMVGLLVGLAGCSGLLYWLWKREYLQRYAFVGRIIRIGRDVQVGFLSIRQLQQPLLFVVLTVMGNTLSFIIAYVLFFTSVQTLSLPPSAALTVVTVSSLGGLAVPTQGGLGTYHFLVSRVLMLYGMPETKAVVAATFMHAVQTAFSLLFSSVGVLILPMIIRRQISANQTIR
ncbi:flippase-like domain-containing protein [Spirosoma sp. BT702]|uniref:Flippase-like domain-containing protein n=1 Tax=Spirosoma profusum TaxID=2771354 RepID=A0A926XXI5_9BACT|nr:lysylphosphatidylglycerol synthase transmembrane domain-containing protein [Spirosoma profusum]MBD2699767.1 flippase-like domain-containing protein [Spirosoma profusum]